MVMDRNRSHPANILIRPSPRDARVSPLAGFPADFRRQGFTEMHKNDSCWDWSERPTQLAQIAFPALRDCVLPVPDSNDNDICCQDDSGADPAATGVYLNWGASTQGKPQGCAPDPAWHGAPGAKHPDCTNAVGYANKTLAEFYAGVFGD